MYPWMKVLSFLVGTYLSLCVGYFIFHRFFIFHPSRNLFRTPDSLGMPYEEVFFPAGDGTPLQGWWLPIKGRRVQPPKLPAILFCPGNEGTLSKFLSEMHILHAAGFGIFMFSYRGFGKSRGFPSERGVYSDVQGAWNYLKRHRGLRSRDIVLYGQSLGCALAAHAAGTSSPRALVLEGGFTSVAQLAQRAIPWLPLSLLTTERFSTLDHLKQVRCPVLLAHSPQDKNIPFSESQALYNAARQPKSMIRVKGAHAQALMRSGKAFTQAIHRFLQTH